MAATRSTRRSAPRGSRRRPPYHVERVGPVESDEGRGWFFAVMTDEFLLEPVIATDAAAGLRAAIARHGDGPRTCDPSLLDLGAALGFRPGELPEWAPAALASISLLIVNGTGVSASSGPEAIDSVLLAAGQYTRVAPWGFWDDTDIIELRVLVGEAAAVEYAAIVMGAGGIETGLALYQGAEAIDALRTAGATGDLASMRRFPILSITFEREPAWAAARFGAAFGLAAVPIVLCSAQGRVQPAGARELAILAGALTAVLPLSHLVPAATIGFVGEPFGLPDIVVSAGLLEDE